MLFNNSCGFGGFFDYILRVFVWSRSLSRIVRCVARVLVRSILGSLIWFIGRCLCLFVWFLLPWFLFFGFLGGYWSRSLRLISGLLGIDVSQLRSSILASFIHNRYWSIMFDRFLNKLLNWCRRWNLWEDFFLFFLLNWRDVFWDWRLMFWWHSTLKRGFLSNLLNRMNLMNLLNLMDLLGIVWCRGSVDMVMAFP